MPAPLPRRAAPLFLLLAPLAPSAAQTPAQPYATPPVFNLPAPEDPATELSRHLRELAENPRDLAALLGAGHSALAAGDANAAIGFFGRADQLSPGNPRVKAGLGAALVQMEQPREALRLFDQATGAGMPPAEVATDRGLAYDLRGENRRAQAEYQAALRANPRDDEATRRYALSLAIAGDRTGAIALLDPLMRRQDKAAWRASAFVLALTGDAPAAIARTELLLPRQQAAMIAPFFPRLAALNAAQKASAVHFGRFPGDGRPLPDTQLADLRDGTGASPSFVTQVPSALPYTPATTGVPAAVPYSALPAPTFTSRRAVNPRGSIAGASAVPTMPGAADRLVQHGAPLGSPLGQRSQAATPLPAPQARVTGALAPPPGRTAPAVVATAGVTAPGPGFRSAPLGPAKASPPPSSMFAADATPHSARATPAFSSGIVPQPRSTTVAGPSLAAPAPPPAAAPAARIVELQIAPPPISFAPPAPVLTQIADASPVLLDLPPPVLTARAAPVETSSAPAQPERVAPRVTDAAPPKPAPPKTAPVVKAPPAPVALNLSAPTLVDRAVRERARRPARPTGGSTDDLLAVTLPADLVPASSVKAKPAPTDDDAPPATSKKGKADKSGSAKTKEDKTPAETAKTDKLAAAKTKADKAEAAQKAAAGKEPERYWVQVATGANKGDLPKAWSNLKAKYGAQMAGRSAWTTPLRFTNRLLVGPFKSSEEAQDFVNQTAKAGLGASAFTSQTGQAVERMEGK